MRYSSTFCLAVGAVLCACGTNTGPAFNSGLRGQVIRGPVTPVCTESIPCDQPFAAGFALERNGRRVATFRSDSEGHFEVRVPPGAYRLIPNSDAPIMMPEQQIRDVTVGESVLTEVLLHFDTGLQ